LATTNYNTDIPGEIMTPDAVETRIGTLTFVDGVPTPETTRLAYDHLDFLRGVEVFLNFVPAASLEAMRRGNVERGAKASHQALIFDQLMDTMPRHGAYQTWPAAAASRVPTVSPDTRARMGLSIGRRCGGIRK